MSRRIVPVVLIALLLLAVPTWAGAQSPQETPEVTEVLIDFKDDIALQDADALGRAAGVTLRPNSPHAIADRLYVGTVPPGRMDAVIQALAQDPRVESAEPNFYMTGFWNDLDVLPRPALDKPTVKPNDPLYTYQWHMQKIGMEEAWVGATGKDVVVAVIDTGVAYENYGKMIQVEDLKNTSFVKGWNYVGGNAHANDDHGHGTHVAGTIAQTTHNAVGVTGVAYHASIMPLKVLSARGFGKVGDIADAIRFAAKNGAHVVNMSLGGPSASKALENAVKAAHKAGVVVVCAAGNNGTENVSYPARYQECIAVSATRFDDQLTFYTNKGKRIDVAAPGGDMNVDQNDDGYKDGVLQNTIVIGDPTQETYSLFQGTSMASPHVAGVAALLVSLGVTEPEAVRARLVSTARKEGIDDLDKGYGGGVLDASKAVLRTAVLDPLARLVLALALLAGLAIRARVLPGLMAAVGLLIGSAGLFFLPYVGVRLPLVGFVSHALPDWDLAFVGISFHANALFWSALIPLGLAMATFGQRRLQSLCMGLCVGMAAFFLHQVLYTCADIQSIPGIALDKVWLAINAAACMFLAYVLAYARKKEAMLKEQ